MKKIYVLMMITIILLTGCLQSEIYDAEKNMDNHPDILDVSKNAENIETDEAIARRLRDLEKIKNNLNLNYRFNNKNYPLDITKEEFEARLEEIRNKIPRMNSDFEFYFEVQSLISKLKDGHTLLMYESDEFGDEKIYYVPININKIEGRWIISGVYNDYKEYLGYEITAVNGICMEEIYNMFLENFISYENIYWAEFNFPSSFSCTNILKYIKIIKNEKDDIELTVNTFGSDEYKKVNFKAIDSKDYVVDNFTYILPEKERKNYASYEIAEDTYFIELNSCKRDDNYGLGEFGIKVISDIDENKYKKIIIDLRYNTGGYEYVFESLIDRLKKLQISDKFDVYTLIGGLTYSASIPTIIYINNNLINTLCGTPTGGKPGLHGNTVTVDLETSLTLGIAPVYRKFTPYDDMMAIYPDIIIEQTYEDYMNKIDTVVKEILLRE